MSADFGPLGVAIGHATDAEGATGLTVIRGIDKPLNGAAAVFGRATGTRELHTLAVEHLVGRRIDAVLLTGGSAYGLDAAAGVMRWMEERGRGFAVPGGVVPIVPAAVVFDLRPLGRFDARPTAQMAYDACDRARPTPIEEGSVGVGTGATVGKIAGPASAMKGGFGCAVEFSAQTGVRVGAVAVVNAVGDIRDSSGHIIAGARGADERFLDAMKMLARGGSAPHGAAQRFGAAEVQNTTLAVVVSNTPLGRVELGQLAKASGAALFKRITPTGTSVDGDVIFALAPAADAAASEPAAIMELEALAVSALERAIERGVRLARGRDGIPGLADR